ncbi:MAG: tetratricopeptide repeat protein [Nitrospirae bacterium]|nr:tetratricopeptide repeat protein [Nitrospirota bacterium]
MAGYDRNNAQRTGSFRAADVVAIGLAIAIVLVYLPVRNFDFIRYDDEKYVTENPHVLTGLTAEGLLWAFKTTEIGFWQPLPWISHMMDVEVFGLNAGAHHLVNVVFHAMNTIILFMALGTLTGAVWRSAFVAALFALHPMHVESVAWVAERKDMCSGLFWVLAILAYTRFARRPSVWRYLPVLCCFILGLMSKPMVAALPVVLLLLDYWPLGRFSETGGQRTFGALFMEKLPMFVISAAAALVTFYTETAGRTLTVVPLSGRIANAALAYALYIGKMFYPVGLSVIYPINVTIALWQICLSVFATVGISAMAIWHRKRFPYLFTGWFWFVIVMLPSSGIVTFGAMEFQAMADRYTYVPYIGLFLTIAMAPPDDWLNTTAEKTAAAAAAIFIVIVSMAVSATQLQHWRDTITVFQHAVKVTDSNYVAYNNLGTALALKGIDNASYAAFETAVTIAPEYKTAYINLGNLLMQRNKPQEAMNNYQKALSIDPLQPGAYLGVGVALLSMGKSREAELYFNKALAIEPNNRAALHYLQALYGPRGEK